MFQINQLIYKYHVNSYCAIVAQEQRKVDDRNYLTRYGRSKQLKHLRSKQNTLQIKGFMYGFSPQYIVNKNLLISVDSWSILFKNTKNAYLG